MENDEIRKLPADWYQHEIREGVRLDLPGIYEWIVEGSGRYIGKYTHQSRPFREYERNVLRILRGHAYRPRKPDGFRRIHRSLAQAVLDGRRITLVILENCSLDRLHAREAELIAERGTLNGRDKGCTLIPEGDGRNPPS